MNPYIIVNGQSSLSDKINTFNQISNPTARQQWKTAFTKNRNLVSRFDTLVILNNRNASITFPFNVSAGNYDIYLRCIAPTSNTDTSIIRLDSTKPKILDLKRRPQQSISQQVNVLLFSNIVLNNGSHSLTVAYKEPIGLIRLTIRKKHSTLQIVIPAIDMLYKPPPQAPIIQPAPAVAYESTTQGPIIEAEYKPVEITTTTEGPVVIVPPLETTTTTEGPQVVVPPYETTTSSEAPVVPPPIIPPPPLEITTSTSAVPSSTGRPIVKEVSKKKQKKGFPWWAIVFIIVVVLVAGYLFYRWWKPPQQGQSGQQIMLDYRNETLLLNWVKNKLSDTTLPVSQRNILQSLKGALQSQSKSPADQALIRDYLKCRNPEEVLLKWLQGRINDPTLLPTDRKQYSALIQGLKKKSEQRSQQQNKNINTLLDCKDANAQKQQKLLVFVENKLAKQGLTPNERNQYTALRQALKRLPRHRSQKQKQQVSFAIQCAQQGKPIVSKTQQQKQQQQKARDQAQAGATAGPIAQPPIVPLLDFSFLKTGPIQQQKQSPPIVSPVKTQILPQTLRSSLTNKFVKINDKYQLGLIEPFGGQEDLGSQLFNVAQKDKQILPYLQKFDPASQQSQKQFPDIKQKLNNLFPQKKDSILIQKILQQSLNKQKRRHSEAFQGAVSMFAGAQKKADQQDYARGTRQHLQLQRTTPLKALSEYYNKPKQQQPKATTQTGAVADTGGQFQRLIKLRTPAQDGHIKKIRQGLKQVNRPK